MCFTVTIPTYNRAHLVGRTIGSVLDQRFPDVELLVVDDGSTDDTATFIRESFPQVRYLRQDRNCGVGAARNRGIREATRKWIVAIDDDDTLLPGALQRIASHISELADVSRYPVLQFAHGNGSIPSEFLIMRLEEYLANVLKGDFLPVIQREAFLSRGFAYPEFVRAGESLLWWKVAQLCGIPTWADRVASVGIDAPTRITSVDYQIEHAIDYAELQEHILEDFGEILASKYPSQYEKKRLGAAAYWTLAGKPSAARVHLRAALDKRLSVEALLLGMMTLLPRTWAIQAFSKYRKRSVGWER